MYAWGGATGDWRGSKKYDYGSARAKYDKAASAAGATGTRTFATRREPDMGLVDPRGKTITTDSVDPIVIGIDVTGSMIDWPGEIFDRLPLLYQTLAKYRPNAEFSFCAIGDATSDRFSLQVNDFSKDINELEKAVKALGAEGGGGGQITESYELFGYYMLNHCKTPNATSPFLLIFGDETFYNKVNPDQVKHYVGDDMQSPLSSKEMWRNLMQRFELFYLQKPYGRGDAIITSDVKGKWSKTIGRQRVIDIPSMDRSVDIGMGLIAKQWGEYADFTGSLDARHDDTGLKSSVHKSLRHIDGDPSVKSITRKSSGSKLTDSLLGD